MKVSAHPLMVAVALGLLGPGALASDSVDDEPTVHPDGELPPESAADLAQVERALDDQQGPAWGQLTLHPADAANGWDPAR